MNVVLTALKKAEENSTWILRFYEFAGRETRVHVHLPAGASRVFETDLMEKEIAPLTLEDGEAIVLTRPYEIKTLKLFISVPTP